MCKIGLRLPIVSMNERYRKLAGKLAVKVPSVTSLLVCYVGSLVCQLVLVNVQYVRACTLSDFLCMHSVEIIFMYKRGTNRTIIKRERKMPFMHASLAISKRILILKGLSHEIVGLLLA